MGLRTRDAARKPDRLSATTAPNHLSCLRSSSDPRRYRRTAAAIPRTSATSRKRFTHARINSEIFAKAGTPNGFSTPGMSSNSPGRTADAASRRQTAITVTAPTRAQRRERNRPSGKIIGRRTTKVRDGMSSRLSAILAQRSAGFARTSRGWRGPSLASQCQAHARRCDPEQPPHAVRRHLGDEEGPRHSPSGDDQPVHREGQGIVHRGSATPAI